MQGMQVGHINVLTREAVVQAQLPPGLRAIAQGMTMVGMAGAPVIVGDSPKTPAERQAAHHGLPVPGPRAFVSPIIVGRGGRGGGGGGWHGHGRGRGGIAFIGPGWWGGPSYYPYPVATAPDCQSIAAQAAQDWSRFGVTQVYCGSSPTGAPALVAVSNTPDAARRGIPPVYFGMQTSVR